MEDATKAAEAVALLCKSRNSVQVKKKSHAHSFTCWCKAADASAN